MTREEAIQVLQEKIDDRPLFKDEREAFMVAIEALSEPNMIPIKLEKRYPESRDEDITDAFMQGYLKGKADRPKGDWIPCSERLPKEKQEVYVTVYFIEGDTGRAYGYMDGFGGWHLYSTVEGTLNSGYEVIAWMPLPKPYNESEVE